MHNHIVESENEKSMHNYNNYNKMSYHQSVIITQLFLDQMMLESKLKWTLIYSFLRSLRIFSQEISALLNTARFVRIKQNVSLIVILIPVIVSDCCHCNAISAPSDPFIIIPRRRLNPSKRHGSCHHRQHKRNCAFIAAAKTTKRYNHPNNDIVKPKVLFSPLPSNSPFLPDFLSKSILKSSLNNHNNHDPFVDEADELFDYMVMFEEEDTNDENNGDVKGQEQKIDEIHNQTKEKEVKLKNGHERQKKKQSINQTKPKNTKNQRTNDKNDLGDDNRDRIDNLIIPDLATLLSSASTGKIANNIEQGNTKVANDDSDSITNPNTTTASSSKEQQESQQLCTKYIDELAPAESIAYFYLQNTIGLPPDVMWKITNEAGSVLGFTVPNLRQKISFLQRIMNLSNNDIRTILTKQPSILHLSSNRNISQKVLFLVRALDLSKNDLRSMVLTYPCILCYSIPNLQKKISFFQDVLEFGIGVTTSHGNHENHKNELRELLVQHPKLLTAAVDDSNYYYEDDDDDMVANEEQEYYKDNNLIYRRTKRRQGSGGLLAKFKFLYQEIGIPIDDLKYIIKRNPNILLYSLQNNIEPKLISLFIMRLRMDPVQICKVLKSFPHIIDYNMENHLLPITRYFLTDLEFSPMEFRSIVLKFPKIFSHSQFKIKHVVGYFRYQLGMNASQVKRILFQAPQVISLNTDDTLVSKVEFMKEVFGLSSQQVYQIDDDGSNNSSSGLADIRKVIAGMPTLLLCSVEKNLRPKAEYLLGEFGGDQLELRQAVLTLPTLFGYSLEKRIQPRMKLILDADIEPIKITVGITMTEENFKNWLSNQKMRIQNEGARSISQHRSISRNLVSEKQNEGKDDATGTSRIMHWKR